jgi:hypothetical protein
MMKKCLLFLCVLIILGGWGCSIVTSERPLGEMPLVLNPAEWEGTWITTEGAPVVIKVEEPARGRLKLAWIEGDKDMVLKTASVTLLKSGAWTFANLTEDDRKNDGRVRYLFARVKKDKGNIIVWLPRSEKFAGLVEGKILPGSLAKETILLGELGPEHLKIIASEDRGVLFDWENPFVLTKTGE